MMQPVSQTTTSQPMKADSSLSSAPCRWYHTQRVGRALGFLFLLSGTGSVMSGLRGLISQLFSSSSAHSQHVYDFSSPLLQQYTRTQRPSVGIALFYLLGGFKFIFLGAFLCWWKKYYRDPRALSLYYQLFLKRGFVAAVEEHGWDRLLKIAGRNGLAIKLTEEMKDLAFDSIWERYGQTHLTLFLAEKVITRDYLLQKLYQAFGEDKCCFDEEEEEELEQQKLVASIHCNTRCAPPQRELILLILACLSIFLFFLQHHIQRSGNVDQLLKAMIRYGEWAVVNLGASPRWIQDRLEEDRRTRAISFSQFLAEGGMQLYKNDRPKLISRSMLREKFFKEMNEHGWNFKVSFFHCCVCVSL